VGKRAPINPSALAAGKRARSTKEGKPGFSSKGKFPLHKGRKGDFNLTTTKGKFSITKKNTLKKGRLPGKKGRREKEGLRFFATERLSRSRGEPSSRPKKTRRICAFRPRGFSNPGRGIPLGKLGEEKNGRSMEAEGPKRWSEERKAALERGKVLGSVEKNAASER